MKPLARGMVKNSLAVIVLFVALLGSACSVDPDDDEGGVVGTGIMLRGTVNAIAGVPSARIDVKSSDGMVSTISIDASNDFSTDKLNGEGPWVLRVRTASNQSLFGIAYVNGTRNINTFTDLILRNWFEKQIIDIDTEFASAESFSLLPTITQITDAATSVFPLVADALQSYNLIGTEIVSGVVNAVDSSLDDFLALNTAVIEDGLVSFVLTDPATSTQITTLSELALNSDFAAGDAEQPTTPTQDKLRVLGSAADEIVLVWEPSTDNVAVTAYRVIRDGSIVATTPYPVYIDTGLQPNQEYTYEIVAVDWARNLSEPTEPVRATGLITDNPVPPSAPRLLTERSVTSSRIQLLWVQDKIAGVAGFNVYRGAETETPEFLVRVSSTLATDVNVRENETYCYQVTALNVAGVESERSEILCLDTGASDPTVAGMDPLVEWVLPNIDTLDCTQELRSDAVQSGVTVLTEPCYQVPQTLEIAAGATLRVGAGIVLIFGDGASLVVPNNATLTIDGTPGSPVLLTGAVAIPGYWGGIEFQQSNSPANLLRGAVVQYAGGSTLRAAVGVAVSKARFRMEDTLVRFSSTQGISFNLTGTIVDAFQGNRITDNERVGIVSLNLLQVLDGNSEFTGNTLDKIDVPRDQFDRPMLMPDLGVPFDWNGVSITRASLTIDPGVELIMVGDSRIRVDGAISVNGTAENPITVRAKFPDFGPGNWEGFQLSGRGDKTFNHVNLSYAGSAGEGNGAIKVDCTPASNTKVQIDNADISESASWGIFIAGEGCDTELGEGITYFNNALGDANVP